MECQNCRAELPDAAKFCIECGAPARVACHACGSVHPARATFCAQCGARLALRVAEPTAAAWPATTRAGPEPAAAPAERRQLTVLFCDLVGSTALASRLDPEDLREVIGAYHHCVADTVARFDGFVARYMGDGALVYFGYPHAHEDNAERAVRAALALLGNLVRLETLGEPLAARIGIATGLVIVGELVNAGAAREQTALGETPHLASRLQDLAAAGTIVIGDVTRRLVGAAFEYHDLGTIDIKGFDVPIRAWRVVGERRGADRSLAPHARLNEPSSPFLPEPAVALPQGELVGRERELDLLCDRWEQVKEGQGRVVLLAGEAGIGKSRLLQALVSRIEAEPPVMLELRCSAYDANTPLYPVIDLLPGVLEWRHDDSSDAKRAKLEAFCARHGVSPAEGLPLLVALLGLPASERLPLPPMSADRQKERTLQTLLDIVLALSSEHPVLMLVEDLHWIDPTTMELLERLVDQVPTARVFSLFTARLHFEPSWPPHSHVTTLTLSRFSRRQTEQMVQRVAGGRILPREVVEQIVDRTDGVPLFVEELTKMVLESGLLALEHDGYRLTGPLPPLAIPATLQDSLTARLDRLATVKVVAQLCATLGRQFSYAMLRAVSPLAEPALRQELARLVDAELIYQRGAPPDATYIFKHALIQEAAYQSLLRSTRQQYHQRIAHAMVQRFGDEAEVRPEFVATHFTEAADAITAVHWWRKAGERAFQHASYAEAITHYTKGLHVLEALPPSAARDQSEIALQVELGYALIPVRGWAAAQSADAFTRAGELCRSLGDAPKLFRALWGLGAFHFVRGDQLQARQVADQCLATARVADDVDAASEAHYLSGIVWCAMGNLLAARRDLEECIRLYGGEARKAHRLLYGQDAKASALGWLAMALWTLGEPDQALERANEALAFVADSRQPFLLARGLAGVGFVHVFRGEPQGTDSPLLAAIALCVEQGFTYFRAVVSAFHGVSLVQADRAAEGAARMQANVNALRSVGAELLFPVILSHLGSAYVELGDVERGLAAVADGLQCVQRNGERWAEAELHRVRGELLRLRDEDAHAVETCFVHALDVARAQRARAYELRAATALARHWRRQRRDDAAALLAPVVAAWPGAVETMDLAAARQLLHELG